MTSNDRLLQIFGKEHLWNPQTNKGIDPLVSLANRWVLFYFSASWCKPCIKFTKKLIKVYQNLKNRVKIEFVFCSIDTNEKVFESYAMKMPWPAIPFGSSLRNKIIDDYLGNQGIPNLSIFGKDGIMLEVDDVVEQVSKDVEAVRFPWPSQTISEVLMCSQYYCKYIEGKIEHIAMTSLDKKYLMLYFAAHWKSTCADFRTKLDKIYSQLKEFRSQHNDFELLLISADRYEDEYFQHLSGAPFGAVAYEDETCRTALIKRLKVRGVPVLAMLSPVIDGDRSIINYQLPPSFTFSSVPDFPFHPKKCWDLKDDPLAMNEEKCILIFCELSDDIVQECVKEECVLAANELQLQNAKVNVFWICDPNEVSDCIRQSTCLSLTEDIQMILLDLPDDSTYYVPSQSINEDMLAQEIVKFYHSPGLKRRLA